MLYVFRKNIIALLFVSGLFIMAGCEFDIEDHPEPERLVTISLTVGSEPASLLKASTASQEEKDIIGDVVFFGVDAKGGYIDTYPFSIGEQSLTISSRIKTLYAVANPTLDMLAATPSETDLQNMTVDFTAAPASSFLMSGSGVVSGSSVSIALVRSVAKIEIKGKKGFKVTGITVENTPDKGYVFPQSPLAVPDGSVPSYTTSDTIFYVAENTRTAAARTQFTVTGTYDGKTASRTITLNLDLVRNKHYSISISPGEQGAGLYSVAVVDEWVDE
ncbi:MAG: fimbrillin family protein, partial [Bacteroidales bacterium]|nr:fimbrillin family protein [Bacteroidales bacterium]